MLIEDFTYIKENLNDEIQNFNEKKILITGGTGFFGMNLVKTFKYLVEDEDLKCEIFILSRNANDVKVKFRELSDLSYLHFINHDISKPIILKNDIDFVIHCATSASKEINDNHFDQMSRTIINGTINILDFCVQKKAKLLFISSGAVNGINESNNKIKPTDYRPFNPLDGNYSYHLGKICAENLCFNYSLKFDLEIKIARCFAFVGPFLPLEKHFAIGNFINSVLAKKQIIIKSKGASIRSYLYSADLVIWLLKTLVNGQNLKPYNIGSPDEISILDLATLVSKFGDKEVLVEGNREVPTFYVPNIDQTLFDLKISNFIDLDSAINKTIEWNRQ
jgi:dTDP-glucose 4,6-dehydratase